MSFSKKKREIVYAKYDGHCAYCGRAIDIKDMQVDHFFPLRAWGIEDTGSDDILNLMPACRMCNHYKRANSLEQFRRYIAEIPQKLRCDYIFKIGVAYGNIIENEKPIIFCFEVQSEKASKMATEESVMAKPRKLGIPSAYTQNSMYDLHFKRKMYLRKQKIMKSNGRQGETIAAVKLKSEVSKNAMSL